MPSGKAIGTTLVLGGSGATAGAAMGGAFSSKSEEQTQDKVTDKTPQQPASDTTVPTPEVFTNTTGYENKLLTLIKQDNLQYIVKPVSTGDKQEPTQKWWDWALTHKFNANKGNTTLEEPFNAVDIAYDANANPKALNQACDIAYKKEKEDYEAVFTGTSKLLENIKKFCTLTVQGHDVSEPLSTTYSTDKKADTNFKWGLLSDLETAKKLVDTLLESNNIWFKWAFEKRVKDTKAKASAVFSSVGKGVHNTGDSGDDNSLKKACEEAYKKNRYELTDVTTEKNTILKDVGQYCAATQQDLTEPLFVPEDAPTGIQVFSKEPNSDQFNNGDYKGKLISLMRKDNLDKLVKYDSIENRTWWDWAFKKKYQAKANENTGKLKDIFTGITKGYSSNPAETKALNQACHIAYKQESGEYKFGTNEYLLKNIGQFCNTEATEIDVSEPNYTAMKESDITTDYESDKIFGSKDKNVNNKLVKAIDSEGNKLWWEWAHHRYTSSTSPKKNPHFESSKVTQAYSKGKDGDNVSTALNLVCDAAYKKAKNELNKTSETPTLFQNVQDFCSPSGTTLDALQ